MHDPKRRSVVNGLVAGGVVLAAGAGSVVIQEPTLIAATGDPRPPGMRPLMEETSAMSSFAETLHASGPHPSLGQHAETFGRLIGSWAGEYRDRRPGEPDETGTMEVHFGWVLQGRAVQDTWIAPPRPLRAGTVLKRQTYGTTIRVFHPEIAAWRAVWLNPVAGVRTDLIGRRVGEEIVQFCLGRDRPEKWVFSAITPRSFSWRALLLEDDGVTWRADTEFQLHRTA